MAGFQIDRSDGRFCSRLQLWKLACMFGMTVRRYLRCMRSKGKVDRRQLIQLKDADQKPAKACLLKGFLLTPQDRHVTNITSSCKGALRYSGGMALAQAWLSFEGEMVWQQHPQRLSALCQSG